MSQRKIISCIIGCLLSLGVLHAQQDRLNDMLQSSLNTVTAGTLLHEERFDSSQEWQPYNSQLATMRVEGGQYRIDILQQELFIWENIQQVYRDVIVQAEVTFWDDFGENAFAGLMCRNTSYLEGYAYLFELDTAGNYSITVNTENGFIILASGKNTQAIRQGQSTHNVTIVCIEDYLAFYANETLLVETVDNTFLQGLVGWTAGMYSGYQAFTATFDNINIWAGSIAPTAPNMPQTTFEQGTRRIIPVRHLFADTFNTDEAWLNYQDGITRLSVEAGKYILETTGEGFAWSPHDLTLHNVIIEVEIAELLSDAQTGVGVVCRQDLTGSGYFFWIGSDGFFNISRVLHSNFTDYFELVESRAIPDFDSSQPMRLTAVCVDEYLALYLNDTLLGEARDFNYLTGTIGMAIRVDDNNASITAQLDNLNIWSAFSPDSIPSGEGI